MSKNNNSAVYLILFLTSKRFWDHFNRIEVTVIETIFIFLAPVDSHPTNCVSSCRRTANGPNFSTGGQIIVWWFLWIRITVTGTSFVDIFFLGFFSPCIPNFFDWTQNDTVESHSFQFCLLRGNILSLSQVFDNQTVWFDSPRQALGKCFFLL